MLRKLISFIIIIYILALIYYPGRHAKHYQYIEDEYVLYELINQNLKGDGPTCDYKDIILSSIEYDVPNKFTNYVYNKPQLGGSHTPNCKALFKSAIIVPYRNRKEHLDLFLNYMHYFLQQQSIQYRIFIVEQNNTLPFNRAKMLNIGAYEAMKLGYECLILHDVDLLPLSSGNIYACSKQPRHMCSSLDTFRFNLPYLGLFGGVVSIHSKQFQDINGMSNYYDGWGGEDDDLYVRLETAYYVPYRFSPHLSKYTMLMHKKEKPSENRYKHLSNVLQRQKVDGLNTLNKTYIVKLENLSTHIFVNSK